MEKENSHYEFQIALSYAGEQKTYVEALYSLLVEKGLKVFYSNEMQDIILGVDLNEYLTKVYSDMANYCILFISKEYSIKLWTNHEMNAIKERQIEKREGFILPLKFDDTEIPGLSTTASLDIRSFSLNTIADIIWDKVYYSLPFDDDIKRYIDNRLTDALATAAESADNYLKPQSLHDSQMVVDAVAKSFKDLGIIPNSFILRQYMFNDKAAFRVVGYLAYQLKPFYSPEITIILITCVLKEINESISNKETRPLWQLVICLRRLLKKSKDKSKVLEALEQALAFLKSNASIDPEGQCKRLLSRTIKEFSQII